MENNYALIDATGIVQNIVVWDGVPFNPGSPEVPSDAEGNGGSPAVDAFGWTPPDGFTTVEITDSTGTAYIGLGYANGVFVQPSPPVTVPPTAAQILAANTANRDSLLAQATAAIAPLQDAVDLDMATDADTAALKAWKTYRVLVNRVDLTQASPTWPTAPAA